MSNRDRSKDAIFLRRIGKTAPPFSAKGWHSHLFSFVLCLVFWNLSRKHWWNPSNERWVCGRAHYGKRP